MKLGEARAMAKVDATQPMLDFVPRVDPRGRGNEREAATNAWALSA